MKRFGDVLRILSSVLVGSVIKDFDALRDHLSQWLGDWWVAEFAAVFLIAMFVRNIHGSVQYDGWLQDNEFSPKFESTMLGRYFAFAFAIAALFLGPFLASHMFVNHPPTLWLGIAALFISPAVYCCWDLFLWFFESDTGTAGQIMRQVTLRWIKINMIALMLSFGVLAFYWIRHGFALPNRIVGADFVVVSSFIVFADYVSNRSFYFPEQVTG